MANNDILTRLLLNTDDFDRKIGKSKKQTDGMAETFTKFGKTASKALIGVAGAIGAATTATEAFNKAIASSDTLADKWKGTMQGMTTAVNEFFHGLTTGDFSTFHQGLDKIIAKAQQAVADLKTLSNFNLSYDFLSAEQNYTLNEALTNLRSKNFTGDRAAEIQKAQDIIDEKTVQTATILEQASRALASNLATATGIGAGSITPELVKQVFETVLSGGSYASDYARWREIEEKNRAAFTKTEMRTIAGSTATVTTFDEEGYNKVMEGWNKKYARAIIENALFESTTNREGIEQALAAYTAAWNESTAVLGLQKTLNKVTEKQEADAEKSAVKAAQVVQKQMAEAAEGSFGYLEKRIAEAKKSVSLAVGTEAQVAAQEVVEELETQLRAMRARVRNAALGSLPGTTTTLALGATTAGAGLAPARQLTTPMKEATNVAAEATETFEGLAIAVSALSGSLGEGGQSWASYMANVLSSVASAIPAISSLVAARQAEKTAAGQAAAAEAAASAAATPLVGPVLAAAAIASVVAALSNMPKFANGGIVGGSSFTGDRLLVRANSGEVILNQAQQRNLLSQLDSRHIDISGELRASGRDLVATIGNYNTYIRQ